MSSLYIYLVGFIGCTAVIVFSGTKLAKYGDKTAGLTGWGNAWVGLVLIASVTSLPELMTSIGSVTIVHEPDLAAGNVFGSCVFNLFVLSLIVVRIKQPITSLVKTNRLYAGLFGGVLIALSGQADLNVIGALGASGLVIMIFGSNTASVMERATCPELAVPANATPAMPKKIVFDTDYEANDIQTMKELIKINTHLKAGFICLHGSKENLTSNHDLIEYFSKAVAKEVNIDQPFFYYRHHENRQKGIDHFVDSVGDHLIALSMRKRGIFDKLFDYSLLKRNDLSGALTASYLSCRGCTE